MARDGSGNYTLPVENPVVTHTDITTDWANTTMADIAAALTDSLSRHGYGGMLVPFRFADGTVAAPGITFANEPTSGLYRAGLNDIRYSIGAADVLVMTPAGITIPAGKTIIFSPGSTINNVVIGNVTPAAGTFTALTAASATINGPLTVPYDQSVLGLGSVDSTTKVVVKGPTKAVRFGTSATGGYVEGVDPTGTASFQPLNVGGSALNLQTGGATRLSIDAAGSVAITLAAGGIALALNYDSAAGNPLRFNDTNAAGNAWLVGAGAGSAARGDFAIYDQTNGKLVADFIKNAGGINFTGGGTVSVPDITASGHYLLTGSAGGLGGGVRYVGAGGGGHWYHNVATGSQHMFAVNETVVGAFTNTGLTITGSLNATVSIQGLQPMFEQAGISLAPNTEGAFSLPAGMARPKLVIAVYRCLTADQGYVAGDEVHPADFYFDNPNYVGLGTWVSATQIGWAIGAQGCTFMHKTNNVGVGPTNLAYWEIVLRAW